jgi:hypothetical protein
MAIESDAVSVQLDGDRRRDGNLVDRVGLRVRRARASELTMALTLPRWLVAALAGCVVVWLAVLRPNGVPAAARNSTNAATPSSAADEQAGAAMIQAADRLRLLQIRDSVLRQTAPPSERSLTVFIGSALGPLAHDLDSLIRDRWRASRPGDGFPTVIAAVLDSSTIVGGGLRPKPSNSTSITTFLPDSTVEGRCLSILRVPVPIDGRTPANYRHDLLAPETIGALVGPCLYFSTFGPPGPAVARWLRDGGWRFAHITDWNEAPPGLSSSIQRFGVGAARRASPRFEYEPRRWTTTNGLACLAGEAGRCASAVLRPGRSAQDTLWGQHVVSTIGADERLFRVPRGRTLLGPSEGWLLSEMVRSLGPQQFAAFWRSQQSVGDAFRSATHTTLDAWVHDWSVRTYGGLPVGPGVSESATLNGVVLLIVAIAIAIVISRKRRVT